MNAERLEQLVVCAGVTAGGLILMGAAPECLPKRIQFIAQRLGKFRFVVGLCVFILGLASALLN